MSGASHQSAPASQHALATETRRDVAQGLLTIAAITVFDTVFSLGAAIYFIGIYRWVLPSQSLQTLWVMMAACLIVVCGSAALVHFRSRVCLALGWRIMRRLDGPVMQAAAMRSLDGNAAAVGQGIRDLNDVRNFITGGAFLLPIDMVISPITLVLFFSLNLYFGLYAVACIVVMAALNIVTAAATRHLLSEANAEMAALLGTIPMLAHRVEAIEGMGMLPAIARRCEAALLGTLGRADRGHRRAKALGAAAHTLRYSFTAGIVGLGVYLGMSGANDAGAYLAASLLIGRVLAPFERLSEHWRSWVAADAARVRLRALLSHYEGRRQAIALPPPIGGLVVDRVVFVAPGADAAILKGVSFTVQRGEAIGIVGPSGSGKSTLARLLVGLWTPSSGGVYLGGTSTYLWERGSFGAVVGYLPQNVQLLEGTVAENIARLGVVDRREVLRAARAAGLHDLIANLRHGYNTPLRDGDYVLSGGQRQRLAFARALYGQPSLLVLDEPNSNLDAAGEAMMVRAISEAKRAGTCIVVVAHRASILSAVDRVLVLSGGLIERELAGADLATLSGASTATRLAEVTPLNRQR